MFQILLQILFVIGSISERNISLESQLYGSKLHDGDKPSSTLNALESACQFSLIMTAQ
jgi:hypothetical protein